MILGIDKLLKLVKEKKLVENLSERELEKPENTGFDMRIGELYEIERGGFLGITERDSSKLKLISNKEGDKKVLEPGKYYVMTTIEKVNMPDNLLGRVKPRSTLYRSGLYVFSGVVDPQYTGKLTFGIANFSDKPFIIEIGARVAHIIFLEIKGKIAEHRSQWQGGRVSTEGTEEQW